MKIFTFSLFLFVSILFSQNSFSNDYSLGLRAGRSLGMSTALDESILKSAYYYHIDADLGFKLSRRNFLSVSLGYYNFTHEFENDQFLEDYNFTLNTPAINISIITTAFIKSPKRFTFLYRLFFGTYFFTENNNSAIEYNEDFISNFNIEIGAAGGLNIPLNESLVLRPELDFRLCLEENIGITTGLKIGVVKWLD